MPKFNNHEKDIVIKAVQAYIRDTFGVTKVRAERLLKKLRKWEV